MKPTKKDAAYAAYRFDQMLRCDYPQLAGIDEAGRGPLAGPVVAAVVLLPPDRSDDLYYDSKVLTEREREVAFASIMTHALDVQVGIIDSNAIDHYNILQATFQAARVAVNQLRHVPDLYLIDGMHVPELDAPQRKLIKGDATSQSIAAASIVAKVTRDHLMIELDQQYPEYGFAKHKGYGTALHLERLSMYGPCAAHRKTFAPVRERLQVREPVNDRRVSVSDEARAIQGASSESYAREYLEQQGWKLLAQNWRCSLGELDLIFESFNEIICVEVRSKKAASLNDALRLAGESISRVKKNKVRQLAEIFARSNHVDPRRMRCDVVLVGISENGEWEISHIPSVL
ncbi:ribonuclease HII [Ferroacidibacillus organovorans]|uniref:Multifunctional fusion protein n=1 Tax=Ferroacidibacillus organovorans TaxID=1765683 RepID=A0A1V4ERZ6_9BACL|nr:ribonuclease HII [Ferroacidibacillus organovorans]OPG15697.1 ribonuclease HII [Ferroacidibacillus organovorans]